MKMQIHREVTFSQCKAFPSCMALNVSSCIPFFVLGYMQVHKQCHCANFSLLEIMENWWRQFAYNKSKNSLLLATMFKKNLESTLSARIRRPELQS
jgi:hypothetical protein